MKLIKKIASVALAATLAFTLVVPANAEKKYDRGESGRPVIDYTEVPTDNGDIKVNINKDTITTSSNVKFALGADVDVTWTSKDSKGEEASIIDENSGEVRIPRGTTGEKYTITATADNGYGTSTINIDVTDKTAVPTRVILDKEKIEAQAPDIITVTSGAVNEQSIECKGSIPKSVELYADVEPSYVLTNTYSYKPDGDATKNAFTTSGSMLSSVNKTMQDGVLNAYTNYTSVKPVEEISIKATEQDFSFDMKSTDLEKDKSVSGKTNYTIDMNQEINFSVEENTGNALAKEGKLSLNKIDSLEVCQTINQKDTPLAATEENEDDGKKTYELNGKTDAGDASKSVLAATVTVSGDKKSVSVKTENIKLEKNSVKALKLVYNYTYVKDGDVQPSKAQKVITLNFDVTKQANVTGVTLDFDKSDSAYNKLTESVGDEEVPVYYVQRNASLNLKAMTSGNVKGVASFESSRKKNFEKVQYGITYNIAPYNAAGEAYANNEIMDSAQVIKESEEIVNDQIAGFTCLGTGYFNIKVVATNGQEKLPEQNYIIRVVTPVDFKKNKLNIKKASIDDNYNIKGKEVAHITKGEAVTPVLENQVAVSLTDPYLDYTFDVDGIVNSIYDNAGNVRISGKKTGKVKVTVTGRADTTQQTEFYVYVNGDQFVYDNTENPFEISFKEAINQGKVKEDGARVAVLGKQEVNLGLNAALEGAGIPDVAWSLYNEDGKDLSEEYATIDKNGILKTKKATSKTLKVIATALDGEGNETEAKAEASFTINSADATGIDEIAEDVAFGKTGVVTPTVKNSGKVDVGETFVLAIKSYIPANATGMNEDAELTWESENSDIASVNEKTGMVTAKQAGTVKIYANYNTNNETRGTYVLTVVEKNVKVSSITASDVTLTKIGDTTQIETVVAPANATNKKLTYASQDEKIAKVDQNGQLTATGVGTTTVEIASISTPDITTTIKVTVLGVDDKPTGKPDTTTQAPAPTPQAPAAPTTTTVAAPTTEAPAAVTAPAKVKISSAKNVKGKKLTIKFKKIAGVKTYQIVYSLKKNFKGKKTINTTKTSYTIKKLKKGKTYYVKVRAKNAAGFGKFSAVKKVKIKK